ncbi:glycosyltransferase family 4 protein [Clostridium sp. BL-8]|uniref:glycosyltransferase family 4 protein n=1 Tax=Clostridium sp. BL-8 TaxID=349938 RepID=UPI00098CB681|nr:glycosyltransferase family 4 protein [Clostridium sp. BL-8]OOM80318.1 spore coat protein SA [Clostridium sp. BL-8]
MKKIAIISSGYFPVPPVKGGAVETLIQTIIDENEYTQQLHKLNIDVYCMDDIEACSISKKYRCTRYLFVKVPKIIEKLDELIYFISYRVLKFRKHMSFRFIAQRIYYIYAVAKKLKTNDYDKVVIENTATLFWTLKLFGNWKKYRGRYVYHLHNEVSSTFGCRKQVLATDEVWGISQFINNSFCKLFPEYDPIRCRVLKNCINLSKFRNRGKDINIREKYGIHDNEKIIIFAGRLCKEKGVKELLLAFTKINIDKLRLIIVGNYYFGTDMVSSFETELFKIAKPLGRKVIFTGYIPNDQLAIYYNSADIAVLPSVWDEPAGLTILEAIACGVPVITTNSGGIPEYVNNDCAIILNKDEKLDNELAVNIEVLLSDKKRMNDMIRVGNELSIQFDKDKYFNNFIKLVSNNKN